MTVTWILYIRQICKLKLNTLNILGFEVMTTLCNEMEDI